MNINKLRLLNRTSYLVASSKNFSSADEFLDKIAQELENGVQIVELRENCDAKRIIDLGKKIRELCSIYNALFIVYDRLDIAQIVHADGILLPTNGIDTENTREILGANTIIGKIIVSENDLKEIENEKIDYLLFLEDIENTTKIYTFMNVKII